MLDPVTLGAAVSGATAAYNGIKKAIMLGKEIEDLGSQLSTWMSAVSDVDNIHKNANNPSAFDKLFNGSIEQVAIESFSSKKKLQKQREELRNFLIANYGLQAWDDLIKEEELDQTCECGNLHFKGVPAWQAKYKHFIGITPREAAPDIYEIPYDEYLKAKE